MALPFSVRSFCSRNLASVRKNVSLTVRSSAASTRFGSSRITAFGGQCRLGEGIARAEGVNDLLLARHIHAMDVHSTALHDVKSTSRITFMKQVFALVEGLGRREGRNLFEVELRQSGKKLATAQRID